MDALMKAITRNDSYGVFDLVLAGKIFMVDEGTKVRVIDRGGFLGVSEVQVRILEGKMVGRSGWLPYEFVTE